MTRKFKGSYILSLMGLVLKLFILQNAAQISVPVNICTCHLVAGCMNHAFSTGSSNTFLLKKKKTIFFLQKCTASSRPTDTPQT